LVVFLEFLKRCFKNQAPGHFLVNDFVIVVVFQSEKKLVAVEWNTVSDKIEQQLGQRLRISHAKVPEKFYSRSLYQATLNTCIEQKQ